MKRIMTFLLLLVFITSLNGCSQNESDSHEIQDTLKLTDEMIREIEKEYTSSFCCTLLNLLFIKEEEYKITGFEITTQQLTDEYTYTIYGLLYYEDIYYDDTDGGKVHCNVDLVLQAKSDDESDTGYRISVTDYSCDLL